MTSNISKPAAPWIPGWFCQRTSFAPTLSDNRTPCNKAQFLKNAPICSATHFAERPEVHIGGAGFVYYQQGDMNRKFQPDMHISFGVDAASEFRRNGYIVWEAGKAPDFALEVASESTHTVDTGTKPGLYARVGIRAIMAFRRHRRRVLRLPPAGRHFASAASRTVIPLTTESDRHGLGLQSGAGPVPLRRRPPPAVLRLQDQPLPSATSPISTALLDFGARRYDLASEAEVERLRAQLRRRSGQ